MDFDILDASAFYAGIPFRSLGLYRTTSLVYDEIMHIKNNHDALGVLLETGRLKIVNPNSEYVDAARQAALKTGDIEHMSRQDMSVIALGLETRSCIITDDYAIANVAGNLGIRTSPVMTAGIRDVGRWVCYCPGCRKNQDTGSVCILCGNKLRRKLIK